MAKKKQIAGKTGKVTRQALGMLPVPNSAKKKGGRRVLAVAGAMAAAGAVAGMAAALASRSSARSPRAAPRVYHVQHDGERWEVRSEGASTPETTHGSKREATVAGRKLARATAPSRMVIHGLDGNVLDTHDYERD